MRDELGCYVWEERTREGMSLWKGMFLILERSYGLWHVYYGIRAPARWLLVGEAATYDEACALV